MSIRDRQVDVVMSSTEDELRELRGRLFGRVDETNEDDSHLIGARPSTEDEPDERQLEQYGLVALRQDLFGDDPTKR